MAAGLRPIDGKQLQTLRTHQQDRVNAALTNLRAIRAQLKVGARTDFQLRTVGTDQFGLTHARFEQTFQGVKVWGAEVIAHVGQNGETLAPTNGLVSGLRLAIDPSLSGADAVRIARQAAPSKASFSQTPTTELVVYPIFRDVLPEKLHHEINAADVTHELVEARVAYHVHTEIESPAETSHTDFIIDAKTGEVLKKWSSLETAAAAGTGQSQYSGVVQLDTDDRGTTNSFAMHDLTRGMGNPQPYTGLYGNLVTNMNGGTSGLGSLYTDVDDTWGDGLNYTASNGSTSANGQTEAVDAAYGVSRTWNYYYDVHFRNGIDDQGTATMSRVHYSTNYVNAFWSDSCFCMTYGDGNTAQGFTAITALDVTGHELSHGVTAQTAALIYTGESGGLNEANSDIHGTMVEFYTRGQGGTGSVIGNTGGNFMIGEDLSSAPFRYMYHPSLDGFSADYWYPEISQIDVHYSSGPMNRAFYFLAQGASSTPGDDTYSSYLPGGMTGIGNDDAAAIWYRALTAYMYPSSNYVDARTSALQSAKDLFGQASAQYAAVANAFAAINVGYTAGSFDDLTPPTIASVGGTSTGNITTITADVTDNVAVSGVDFYIENGVQYLFAGRATSAPYTVTYDNSALPNGTRQVAAVAYDYAGNTTTDFGTADVNHSYTEGLTNGDFEVGSYGWSEVSTINNGTNPCGGCVINYPVSGAHAGAGYAWLAGYGATDTDTISQTFTFPAGLQTAVLNFWVNVSTAETGGVANDTATVQIRDAAGTTVLQTIANWSNLTPTNGWTLQSFDLGTAFSGQTVTLYVTASENASLATNFKFDDFSIRASTVADTEAPTVTASATTSGANVVLSAKVFDNAYVSQVQFFVDGIAQGGPVGPPYSLTVPTTSFANGSHNLYAVATDGAANAGTSPTVQFFIDSTQTQLIANPGFESGTASWTFAGQAFVFNSTVNQHSGSRYARLGYRPTPATSSVEQSVTIPAGNATARLGFWMKVLSDYSDGVVHETMKVQLLDASNTVLATLDTFTNLSNASYKFFQYDVSAYAGQTVKVHLEGTQQSATYWTGFFLDDFSLKTGATADTMTPTVQAAVSGNAGTITLSAAASDNVVVAKIDLAIDGTVVGTKLNSATFSMPYDASALSGTHTLTARAYDSAGNVATSTVNFDVTNNPLDTTPPTVSAAASSSADCWSVDVSATASDDVGVQDVEFYIDGLFLGSQNTPPYGGNVPATFFGAGAHTLVVNAVDASGNSTSDTVIFNIDLPVVAPANGLVKSGNTQPFTATCRAAPLVVDWSIEEAPAGGSIDPTGSSANYVAPNATGLFHVVASDAASGQNITVPVATYTTDINGDGSVDGDDMGLLAASFGSSTGGADFNAAADLNSDGTIDDADINLFLPDFGN